MNQPPTARPAAFGTGRRVASRVLEALAAAVAYAGLTALWFRPAWGVGRDHLTPDRGDPVFNLYVLEWVMRQIRLGLPDLWGANFFHPVPDALALSDHLLGPAAQALPVAAWSGSAVAAYNALLLGSFVLAALATFAVLRTSGCSRAAAFLGGCVFAFSPYRWSQLSHLQVLIAQWIPPLLWCFDRLLAEPRWRRAIPFLVFYLLQVTSGLYLAYMLHVPLAVLLANRAAGGGWRRLTARRALAVLVPSAVIAAVATAVLFLPYVHAADNLGLGRGAWEFATFGATLPAFLTPAPFNLYFEPAARLLAGITVNSSPGRWLIEKSLFPGFVPVALAAVALAGLARSRRRPAADPDARRRWAGRAALAGAVAIFLAADWFTLGRWPDRAPGDPDFVYTALGGALALTGGVWLALRRRDRRRREPEPRTGGEAGFRQVDRWTRGVLLTGEVCLLLSFPVVFEPVSELLPGLAGMRVPARFNVFVSFAIALLAARGADRLLQRLTPKRRALAAAAVTMLLLAELTPKKLPWHHVPAGPAEYPAVYRWLAGRDDVRALLELPILPPPAESRYMLYSTAHWKPIANGFSGHFPPIYGELTHVCCDLVPDRETADLLRQLGISHVVVHPTWRNPAKHRAYARFLQRLEAGEVPWMRQVYADGVGDRVFELLSSNAQTSSSRVRFPPPIPSLVIGGRFDLRWITAPAAGERPRVQ